MQESLSATSSLDYMDSFMLNIPTPIWRVAVKTLGESLCLMIIVNNALEQLVEHNIQNFICAKLGLYQLPPTVPSSATRHILKI